MPILENQRHETFALAISDGLNNQAAYLKAYSDTKPNSACTLGGRLRRVELISNRIIELKSKLVEKSCVTKQEIIEALADILRRKPVDVKSSDVIRAAERLCKMLGWDVPEEHVVSGDFTINDQIAILLQQVAAVRQSNKNLFKPGETNADPP